MHTTGDVRLELDTLHFQPLPEGAVALEGACITPNFIMPKLVTRRVLYTVCVIKDRTMVPASV